MPDHTAKFLAGLPPSSDSPLAALTNDGGWQRHASRFNALFGEEDRIHLSQVRAFAKAAQPNPRHASLYVWGWG
jgi:hypothetical protein